MSKSSMIAARIDPDLKTAAEDVLSRLGITAGGAITMFYKQIVLQQALPFPLTLRRTPPSDLSRLSRADFDREMQLADDAIRQDRVQSVDSAFADS
jgi:DNA-damage-inducible protein J